MRAILVVSLLIALTGTAFAEPPAPAAASLDVYRFTYDPFRGGDYGGDLTVMAALLAGQVRIDGRTWLAGSVGGAYGQHDDRGSARAGNALIGIGARRALGAVQLDVGAGVTIPIAAVGVVDGVRDPTQAFTLHAAAIARGSWNRWLWLPEWMTVVVPVRASWSHQATEVSLEGAVAVAYAVGGEHADTTTMPMAQVALEARHRVAPRWRVDARLSGAAARADGATDGDGAVELGGAHLLGETQLSLRAGYALGEVGYGHRINLMIGAAWALH